MAIENGQVADADDVSPFGNGSNGAFNQTSASTTNLTQGTVYQYTTFNLGASHTISCSSTSDKPLIILVQGDCTISGTFNLVGKGFATEADGYLYIGSASATGENGFGTSAEAVGGSSGYINGGRKGGRMFNFQTYSYQLLMNGTSGSSSANIGSPNLRPRGGAGGASSSNNGSGGATDNAVIGSGAAAGGGGGCTLILIVGGDLTFGAASVINVSGAAGSNGDGDTGGGGGGGSGDILIFYNGTLTDNGVTKTKNGGAGGTGGTSGTAAAGGGGGAGRELITTYNTIFWGSSSHPT